MSVLGEFYYLRSLCLFAPRTSSRRRQPRRNNSGSTSVIASQQAAIVNRCLHSMNRNPSQTIFRVLHNSGTFTSNGSGVLAAIINLSPTVMTDWSNINGLYDEYRLIGAELIMCSVQTTAVNNSLFCVVYDNDDTSTGLSSFGNALDYNVKKVMPAIWANDRVFKLQATCFSAGSPNTGRLFQSTALSAYPCSFKTYAGGLTNSTGYIEWAVSVVVEMRGQN